MIYIHHSVSEIEPGAPFKDIRLENFCDLFNRIVPLYSVVRKV